MNRFSKQTEQYFRNLDAWLRVVTGFRVPCVFESSEGVAKFIIFEIWMNSDWSGKIYLFFLLRDRNGAEAEERH